MIRYLLALLAVASLGVTTAAAVPFDHAAHDAYLEEADCSACHKAGAESIVPELEVCLECHDAAFTKTVELPALKTHGPVWALNHRPFAKGEAIDCASCHGQDECLECHGAGFADEMGDPGNAMINVHRSDFSVSHPIAARTDPQLCTSCHREAEFCIECHGEFRREELAGVSHRRGWSSLSVSGTDHGNFAGTSCQVCHPDSVLPSHDWSSGHAREARKNLATCAACHPQGDVCLTCHSARSGLGVNPHPKDWNDIKDTLRRAGDRRTCLKCH